MTLCGACGSYMGQRQHTPPIWLPCGTCGSHTAHTTPIKPPFWEPYSSHMVPVASHMAPSDSHLAPIWHTWLQHGVHGSHMVPHSACGSHMAQSASNMVHTAPIQSTHLSYGAVCHLTPIHCRQLRFCACGSLNGVCNSRMLPSSFPLVESGSQKDPIQCTWLPYGTHTSQMAPSASHMAPYRCAAPVHTSTHRPLNCIY
jgi:hypothetical protein